MPLARDYLRIYFAGLPAILLYNFEAAIFRAVGDTKVPLLALAAAGIINVALNIVLCVFWNMTVDGVALATVIANAVSALLMFRRLRKTTSEVRLEKGRLHIHRGILGKIVRIGLPAGLPTSLFSVSNLVVQAGVNSLGTIVMAGSSSAIVVESITYAFASAYGQACTTFVGQNYGAGSMPRCKRALGTCMLVGTITLGTLILFAVLAGRPILSLFNRDPRVVELGYQRLCTLTPAHIFSMLYEVMAGYLRGFGVSMLPALITMGGVCGLRIVWMSTVFVMDPTFQTLLNVYPVTLSATAAMMAVAVLCVRPTRRFAGQTLEK